MADAFITRRGGVPLNFKVTAYDSDDALLAAAARENTIGIVTTAKITSYIFSASEPSEPVEGMVWILLDSSATVSLNALKKNGIILQLSFCRQYVGGVWVVVSGYIYTTEWVSIWNGYLYIAGEVFTPYEKEVTSGSLSFGNSYITVSTNANENSRVYARFGPIPMDNVTELRAKFEVLDTSNGNHYGQLFISQEEGQYYYSEDVTIKASLTLEVGKTGIAVLDLSDAGLTGNYYIYVGSSANNWVNARKYAIHVVRAIIGGVS